jgi:hypothetical protein
MVRHQDELVEMNVEFFNPLAESFKESLSLLGCAEQPALVQPAIADHSTRDVIDSAGKLDSAMPCHAPHHLIIRLSL